MTNLIGCLAWYDEDPRWLAGAIESYAGIMSHVVALDGAYALWPDARGHSDPQQAEAIREAAQRAGMGCTIRAHEGAWEGNETEKRSALFSLADSIAEDGDWLLVLDADELLTRAPRDLFDRLASTRHDAGTITAWMPPQPYGEIRAWYSIRKLFRAGVGLRVVGHHARYVTADGRYLWNGPQEPAEGFEDIMIEHRDEPRPAERAAAKNEYYRARDELGIEKDRFGNAPRTEAATQ